MKSPLASVVVLSPHKRQRTHQIDTISIHCMAANGTIEACGKLFQGSRVASSNYGIGSDGRIACYVPEEYRSIATNSTTNDDRAITIEVANDGGAPEWHVSDKAMAALVDLLVDICQRNEIDQLRWRGDKSLIGKVDKQNMTVHRWFASKACPGDYLFKKHGEIAAAVNERLEEDKMPKYRTLNDVPAWYRPTIEKLLKKKYLTGSEDPDPTRLDDNVLNVTEDFCRIMTVLDKAGVFK